jgi:transposase
MLGLPPSVRIYFAAELADMRNGIDGLRALVEGTLRHDPYAGHLFVFVGKGKDKVKILFWDRSGFVLYMKRLEKGRFQLPIIDARRKHVEMEPAQLAMLLDGIDLNAKRLARWTPDAGNGGDTGRGVLSLGLDGRTSRGP